MFLTQGTFSYLPPFSDAQLLAQVGYAIDRGWSVSLEHTDSPHPRNVYWEMFGLPFFDLKEPQTILAEIGKCKAAFPDHYIKVNVYDRSRGRQTTAFNFIVNRPKQEPQLRIERTERQDRRLLYTLTTSKD